MKILSDRNSLNFLSIFLGIIFFLSINVLSNNVFKTVQIDLTQDSLFTVSKVTKDILKSLDEPINLKFYKSSRVSQIPSLSSYAIRVEEFLQQYERISDGKINLEIFEPEQFSVEEDQAVGFGIQALPVSSAGDVIYFGLAGTNSTDDEDIISIFSPSRESFLEYDLSKLVFNLSKPKKTVVSMISTLPLAADPRRKYSPWVVHQQASQFFDIRIVGGNIKKIDDETDIVLLIQPTNLSETTLYAIDQFLIRGGKLLAFIDPHVEVVPPPKTEYGEAYKPPPTHVIGKLLETWGIEMPNNKIVGDRIAAQRVGAMSGGRRVVTDYLPWLSIGKFGIDKEDVITSEIERINVISAGYLKLRQDSNLTMKPLIFSSNQSQLLNVESIRPNPNPVELLSNFVGDQLSKPIAARFVGKINSSFPEGPPDRTDDTSSKGPDPKLVKEHQNVSARDVAMIIVADSDLLADQIWLRSGGGNLAVPIAQNNDFFVNSLDNLAGSAGLISLRGRGLSNRPFLMVEKIRRDSEFKFRTKERELLANLEETEKKIVELKKRDEGRLILSPQQKQAINDFKREMAKLRAELRMVQHDLQKDIESLDSSLKLLNIGLMPLFIGLIAIILIFVRRLAYKKKIHSNKDELVTIRGERL